MAGRLVETWFRGGNPPHKCLVEDNTHEDHIHPRTYGVYEWSHGTRVGVFYDKEDARAAMPGTSFFEVSAVAMLVE
ncbi:MAG: hypothetical protein A3H70_01025 [Candidatus Komeilibacteria bacterium RIFCSPLOWO2_02_FULL_48_11]|uniref:Uncharacterized protein n=1 Tax=Candidatus Komeilibacteria bacterium RIFCSPLOWO2_02_FULL_48_11 TaxID=1798553 RepID=A0A1G2BT85_9BACT|nr:MAG: hypothetical protein A3H70_01025 [Candidatus Komeilibacteria bacterium RIFCSPLOWO2_02_FULL_48_11]